MTVIEKGLIVALILCPLMYMIKIPHRVDIRRYTTVVKQQFEEVSQVKKLVYMFSKEWRERYGA